MSPARRGPRRASACRRVIRSPTPRRLPEMAAPFLSQQQTTAILVELVRRGWWVTDAERTPTGLIVGFDFLPRVRPNWLKAFEVNGLQCTPDGIERVVEAWRADVLRRLHGNYALTDTVRRLVAEHGPEAVTAAMTGKAYADAA